ncbi:hypothetical protein [Aquibacillus sediminis]|uniref:hypothetical protein n=1 Tax=Aquibacillus sediminis TaxID=2574734 RepID=UPI001109381D|nr:hypothetical protein [Aquibacillus sediminis]
MNHLSGSGKLYLKEYYALKYAENTVNTFLDNLLNDTYQYIVARLPKNVNHYSWSANQAKQGRMELYPHFSSNHGIFAGDKVELSVLYRDVRDYDHMEKTASIRLSIYCRKGLKARFGDIPQAVLQNACESAEQHGITIQIEKGQPLYCEYIDVNLDDVEETIREVGEAMIRIGKGVDAFVDGVLVG